MTLETIRENNFRLFRLYALYINERADFISEEMVREVAAIGGLTADEAFLLLLSEACGVHPTDGGDDEAFFNEWLAPSVHPLDPAVYRADPYYRNIRFPNVTDGAWELRVDAYKPYQAFIMDDIRVDDELRELPPLGYFPEAFEYPVVLQDGREWMLVTPNEVETIRPAVNASRGRCVTFGLGLGYYPYLASLKPDVDHVTVVERDPAAIRLFNQYILPQFEQGEKIEVVEADAFDFLEHGMKAGEFDFAYGDIWHDAGDGVPLYLRMLQYEPKFPGTAFQYWIEDTMLSYLRWQDYETMPREVRDPVRWLGNANVKARARAACLEKYKSLEKLP